MEFPKKKNKWRKQIFGNIIQPAFPEVIESEVERGHFPKINQECLSHGKDGQLGAVRKNFSH